MTKLQLPKSIEKLWQQVEAGAYNNDPELLLLHYATIMARKEDASCRTISKHYGSNSPLLKPLRHPFIRNIYGILDTFLGKLKGDSRNIQGSNRHLLKILATFTNEYCVPPRVDELEQPHLGLFIIANVLATTILDNLTIKGQPSIEVMDLADKLMQPLEIEYWCRMSMREHTDVVESALHLYGTKAQSTLDQRLKNIALFFNRQGVKKPQLKNLKESCIALISLMVDPGYWQDGKTLLVLVNDKKSVELNAEFKAMLDDEDLLVSWTASAMLPITERPLPWRATGAPDAFNTSGGFHNEELRRVNPVGHGRHRLYRSVSSQEAVTAVNIIQSTQYVIDKAVAQFVLDLIELNRTNRDIKVPSLQSMPRWTRDEIADGTADLPEVQNRKLGAQLIPDKDTRNSAAGLAKIQEELKFDWEANNKVLKDMYGEALNQQERYRRTCMIERRLKELMNDHFSGGMYFVAGIDHRGRIYAKSDAIGPQGSKPERACLVFAKGERLTKESLREVHIAIGGAAAGTKISYNERERVGIALHNHLIDVGADLMEYRDEIFSADAPWTYAQLASGMHRYYTLGQDWNVPLASDATNSGIQWWASITNDPTVMALANLAQASVGAKPSDAYGAIGKAVASEIDKFKFEYRNDKKQLIKCTDEEKAIVIKLAQVRACLKSSIMTKLYSSHVTTRGEDINGMAREHLTEDEAKIYHDKLGLLTAMLIERAMKDTFANQDRAMRLVKQAARVSTSMRVNVYRQAKRPSTPWIYHALLCGTNADELSYFTIATSTVKLYPFGPKAELHPLQLKERLEKFNELAILDEQLKKHEDVEDKIEEIEEWLKQQEQDNTHYADKVAKDLRHDSTRDPFTRRVVDYYERRRLANDKAYAVDAAAAKCRLTWTVPDKTKVVVREPYAEGDVIKVGILPQMRCNLTQDATIDKARLGRAAAPSLIHSLDSCLMRRIVNTLKCDALCVHDSIALLPSRLPQLRELVGKEMAKMVGTDGRDILRHFVKAQFSDKPEMNAKQNKDWMDVRKELLDAIDELPDAIDYSSVVDGCIYAWN
jgi:hypothetical protein